MTPNDYTTSAALDRISRAMDVAELCEHPALCIKRTKWGVSDD